MPTHSVPLTAIASVVVVRELFELSSCVFSFLIWPLCLRFRSSCWSSLRSHDWTNRSGGNDVLWRCPTTWTWECTSLSELEFVFPIWMASWNSTTDLEHLFDAFSSWLVATHGGPILKPLLFFGGERNVDSTHDEWEVQISFRRCLCVDGRKAWRWISDDLFPFDWVSVGGQQMHEAPVWSSNHQIAQDASQDEALLFACLFVPMLRSVIHWYH